MYVYQMRRTTLYHGRTIAFALMLCFIPSHHSLTLFYISHSIIAWMMHGHHIYKTEIFDFSGTVHLFVQNENLISFHSFSGCFRRIFGHIVTVAVKHKKFSTIATA